MNVAYIHFHEQNGLLPTYRGCLVSSKWKGELRDKAQAGSRRDNDTRKRGTSKGELAG